MWKLTIKQCLQEYPNGGTAMKTAMRVKTERGDGLSGMCRLIELNADLQKQQRRDPMLNRMCDILTVLHNQGKQLTLCKVPAYIGIKGN